MIAIESFKANAMTTLDPDVLQNAFPLEPIPSPDGLTDSFGDDVEDDLSILKGRRWDALEPQDFRFHFEVVCWLTPDAFRYYLPAIIKCSLAELEADSALSETELAVDYTLRMLIRSDSEKIEGRCTAIWQTFSVEQMAMVRRWIEALATRPHTLPSSAESLCAVIDQRTAMS